MAQFIIDDSLKAQLQDKINEFTVLQASIGWIPVAGWTAAGAYAVQKGDLQDRLNDIDTLEAYNQKLSSLEAQEIEASNNIFMFQQKIKDLQREKTVHEDYLEDYRQMLAGEGDADNTLLLQDQYNKQQVANAENDLAAYKDSSALELDSLIQQGFSEYTSLRNSQALNNIYASARGSVLGAHNSAAKRAQASIVAFAGKDMKFNESGALTLSEGGEGMGQYAKLMITSRQTVRNNINKLQTSVDAANLAFFSFREEAEDAAQESEWFLEDYDTTLSYYQKNLTWAQESLENINNAVDEILKDAMVIYEDLSASDVDPSTGEKTNRVQFIE